MTEAESWALMLESPFGLLVTAPDGVPFATSIPLGVAHVADIANPQWRQLQPEREVLIVFQAEHAVVSSRWYESQPQSRRFRRGITRPFAPTPNRASSSHTNCTRSSRD